MNPRIRLISTSDVHGCIYPLSYANNEERNLGFARIKTMIDELRDENTLVIDNGDTIEGSPFTFYHYQFHREDICPISQVMKMVGYDYINIGNHDFNYGTKELQKHLDTVGAKCLTANILYEKDQTPFGCEYEIREIAGKKIALFAITTHFIPKWESADHIAGLEFIDALECTKNTLEKIKKENPDYVVAIYHGGFEKDPDSGIATEEYTGENQAYRMIKELGGIDVLIAGHQHRQYCGILDGCAYTEPRFDGLFLSVIDIDTETGIITPQLLEVNAKADEEVLSFFQKQQDDCQRWLDSTLGSSSVDMKIQDEFHDRLHKTQLITFINQVQMETTGADISAAALFLHAPGFSKDITMRQLVSTYPFPNTLVVKKITGKILKEYLEKDMEFWVIKDGNIAINPLHDFPNVQYHNYDMLDGIEYTAHIANPVGSRITSLTRNGIAIKEDDAFTMAINNYRAGGGGEFFMIKDAPTIYEGQESMVDILATYIMKKEKIEFNETHNIEILV